MQELKVNVYSLNELDERARSKAHMDYLRNLCIDASEEECEGELFFKDGTLYE